MRISDWSSDVCSSDRLEHLGRDRPFLEVQLGHDPPDGFDRRFARQRRHIGPHEAEGRTRKLVQIDIRAKRHTARVDTQYLAAALLVGNADHDLAIETTGARSEEHTSELQSLMRISYAVFCLK